MAFRLSFFKTPKHRVFNYTPLYYDPQEERRRELAGDDGLIGEENTTRYLRSRMHKGFQQSVYGNRKHAGKAKLMRIVIFATLATLVFVLIYFTKLMEVLLSTL